MRTAGDPPPSGGSGGIDSIGGGPEPGQSSDLEFDLLSRLGFGATYLLNMRAVAHGRGLTLAEELICARTLTPQVWWRTVADHLGLRLHRSIFLPPRPATDPIPPFRRIRQALFRTSPDTSRLYIAPRGTELDRLAASFAVEPRLRARYAIASPVTITAGIVESFGPSLTHRALTHLKERYPAMSAAGHGTLMCKLAIMVLFFAIAAVLAPMPALTLLDAVFLLTGSMRLAAAWHPIPVPEPPPLTDDALPTYAVLVPLYRESPAVIAALTRSLAQLDYPGRKLSIFLIVEADDLDTLNAAHRACRDRRFRVHAVPPSLPRTKPKALCWVLPFVESDLVTIFDAEDRPARDQLRVAAAAFAAGPDDLACVQAVLEVDHLPASDNWLARQFALEYRVLFRALLPWLATQGLFLPLGGTSNHFRRAALLHAGAWDPYNVTEDADLALRIVRLGGRIDVIDRTTSEEAPLTWREWHLQRTRWMKGWVQTSLVHLQHPRRLARDLGRANLIAFLILIPGQVISALAYPFGLLLLGLDLAGLVPIFADRSFLGDAILSLQLLALGAGGFGALMAIVVTAGRAPGQIRIRTLDLILVPVYWLLLFLASASAIVELLRAPFKWNKTRHGIAKRRGDAAMVDAGHHLETRTGYLNRR